MASEHDSDGKAVNRINRPWISSTQIDDWRQTKMAWPWDKRYWYINPSNHSLNQCEMGWNANEQRPDNRNGLPASPVNPEPGCRTLNYDDVVRIFDAMDRDDISLADATVQIVGRDHVMPHWLETIKKCRKVTKSLTANRKTEEPEKRGPGRPKGSKNRPRPEPAAADSGI